MSKRDRTGKTVSLFNDQRAVSDVTAVVLLIVLVIGGVGAVGASLSGFTDGLAPPPEATVQTSQEGTEMTMTVQQVGDDVDELRLTGEVEADSGDDVQFSGGDQNVSDVSVGDVYTIQNLDNVDEGSQINIVAAGNSQESVIQEVEVGPTS
ncbi:hypothetical protein ACFQDD_00980 [Halorubrum pallidum]|uniref:Archaeal Type IV pilin N-terminal domain-containing protein n=1 Tax=Halorubrum pallidum TaxID=1526114 RepID=A0ABD5T415_9EURY